MDVLRSRAAGAAIVAGIVVATALAGCASGPGSAGTGSSPAVVIDDPGRADAPFVTLLRSGGIDGTLDRVTVSGNGRVVVRHGDDEAEETVLTEAQLSAVREALDRADLGGLATGYPAQGADMFEYTVIADGHHVTATEVAVPDSLRGLVDLLSAHLDG